MINVAAIWTPALQQQNYRSVLDAMARPGSLQTIHSAEHDQACVAVLACLLDSAVSLADPDELLSEQTWPLLQAQQKSAAQADFILCRGEQFSHFEPRLGTLPSPELSATLVIQVRSLQVSTLQMSTLQMSTVKEDASALAIKDRALENADRLLQLSGPGINGQSLCVVKGLHPDWLEAREDWVCDFPMGVDLLLVDENRVLALPRTTKVELR